MNTKYIFTCGKNFLPQSVLSGNAVSTDVDLTLSKVVCLFNHNFPFNFFFFSE